MKTLFFALSLFLVAPALAGSTPTPATEPVATGSPLATDASLLIALDHTIWFQDVVYIHIYDAEEKPIVNGEYSREELATDSELIGLLRKSTRFLSIDNHHYYFIKSKTD